MSKPPGKNEAVSSSNLQNCGLMVTHYSLLLPSLHQPSAGISSARQQWLAVKRPVGGEELLCKAWHLGSRVGARRSKRAAEMCRLCPGKQVAKLWELRGRCPGVLSVGKHGDMGYGWRRKEHLMGWRNRNLVSFLTPEVTKTCFRTATFLIIHGVGRGRNCTEKGPERGRMFG